MPGMIWVEKSPVFGDMVRTKVQFYYHYGIFASESEVIQFGLPNDPLRSSEQIRVLSTDVITFLQGGDLEVMVPDTQSRRQMRRPEQIVAIARERIGEGGYNIIHNNCEHFASDCVFGQPHSSFLQDIREKLRKKLNK
jgi:hypothetical protein